MNLKTKLAVASLLLLSLGTAASVSGFDAALFARLALGGAALACFAWWFVKARRTGAATDEKPRLAVIARTGLSPRAGLALVEVDGKPLLVVHGDGFAEIHAAASSRAPRRRPPSKRRAFKAALRSVS